MPNLNTNLNPGSASPGKLLERLKSASRLHWSHLAILAVSMLFTWFAWDYAKSEQNVRWKLKFDREVEQVIELVRERMKKYEVALWSGVGLMDSEDGHVEFDQWKVFAQSIQIEDKYPGINGFGVIHRVQEQDSADYLSEQRAQRADFQIHPELLGDLQLPITYVIPVQGNELAVGLDMVHEQNRYQAACKARDTGASQITGPITLVQDNSDTPGFLFFAPFYDGGHYDSIKNRNEHFMGLVYAPFIVSKLMHGALSKEKRHVGIRLLDEHDTLYDEHTPAEADFDSEPLFTRNANIELFGRTWTFDIWSTKSFRTATYDSHPLKILLGSILIDLMLLLLFLSLSHSAQRAVQLALTTEELKSKADELERSNKDLEQFAFIASHDLQEPLRKVSAFCELLREEYGEKLGEEGNQYANFAIDGANRMRALVQDLLTYSKIGSVQVSNIKIEADEAFRLAAAEVETSIVEAGATVTAGKLPSVFASKRELCQLFQNLISNSLKYRTEETPQVYISALRLKHHWKFSVSDNGIGIAPKYRKRVFGIFKRLHNQKQFPGKGIGLAICKRIVNRLNGEIWIEPSSSPGCTVCFTIPRKITITKKLRKKA